VLLPGSFKTLYDELTPTLETVREYVQSRLNAEFSEFRPVVVSVRIKPAESLYTKLQRGDVASILDIDDLIAARGVFLHNAELKAALAAAKSVFRIIDERNVDVGRPTDFQYQQPHLIGYLPDDYLKRHSDLSSIKVEIQFTTYIQHALQESTHDVIYKGQRFSWREHRLDARIRGLLEIVDDVLEHLSSVAKVDDDPSYAAFDLRNEILEVVKSALPSSALPTDLRRFAITAEGILTAIGLSPRQLPDLIERHRDLADALSLTPIDKILGMAVRENIAMLLKKSKGRFLVTRELETIVPEAARIPANRRVQFNGVLSDATEGA
jgi:ppGpp synthetase/RelA/SpoT-type nucleotidyltranferase